MNTSDINSSGLISYYANKCRICLVDATGQTLNMFLDNEQSREVLSKIYTCFNIKLTVETELPNVICSNCMEELNIANNFRSKCLTSIEKYANFCEEIKVKAACYNPGSNIKKGVSPENIATSIMMDKYEHNHDMLTDALVKLKSQTETDEVNQRMSDEPLADSQNEFQCHICHKVLRSESSLTKHSMCMHQKRKHVGRVTGCGASRRYHCTKCPYSTPHSQTLVNHMHRHDGVRPYQCDCGKSFTQSSSLAAHRKTHSLTTFYTCSVCGKQFKHAFSLKKHLVVHEKGSFSCDVCQKILKSKKSLQDHMHRHYNIRNYNCEDCGDTFVTSSELQSHRLKHNTDKKVECHLCGYRTNTKKSLIVHLKRHAGNKSFKCPICAQSFYTAGEVRRHRRVHSRDKPYPCPACAQRFTHSSSLNKHVLNLHHIHYKWADFRVKSK